MLLFGVYHEPSYLVVECLCSEAFDFVWVT